MRRARPRTAPSPECEPDPSECLCAHAFAARKAVRAWREEEDARPLVDLLIDFDVRNLASTHTIR